MRHLIALPQSVKGEFKKKTKERTFLYEIKNQNFKHYRYAFALLYRVAN